jgi:hypothetical protein
MNRFSYQNLTRTGTSFNNRRVSVTIRKSSICFHANKRGNGMRKETTLTMGSDECVPEESGGVENAVEDGGGIGESGSGKCVCE